MSNVDLFLSSNTQKIRNPPLPQHIPHDHGEDEKGDIAQYTFREPICRDNNMEQYLQTSTWLTWLIETLKGLLTPVIAIIAAYIAWQQLNTNRQRNKLDRYDRRFKVYHEVIKFLGIMTRDHTNVTTEDRYNFRWSVHEAYFLFGKDVSKYIDEIYTRTLKITNVDAEPFPYEDLNWFGDQFDVAREKFRKYLDISK